MGIASFKHLLQTPLIILKFYRAIFPFKCVQYTPNNQLMLNSVVLRSTLKDSIKHGAHQFEMYYWSLIPELHDVIDLHEQTSKFGNHKK